MTSFPDLREFFDPDLVLPVDGKEYRVKAPSANETLRIRQFFIDPAKELSDEQHVVELLKVLGGELDPKTGKVTGGVAAELDADGAGFDDVVHVGATALIFFGVGEDAAMAFWRTGGVADVTKPAPTPPAKAAPRKRAPAKKAAPKKAPAKRAAK